jgi:hypothetical protein
MTIAIPLGIIVAPLAALIAVPGAISFFVGLGVLHLANPREFKEHAPISISDLHEKSASAIKAINKPQEATLTLAQEAPIKSEDPKEKDSHTPIYEKGPF